MNFPKSYSNFSKFIQSKILNYIASHMALNRHRKPGMNIARRFSFLRLIIAYVKNSPRYF